MARFLSRWFDPTHRPPRKLARCGLRLEALESRTLLSVTALFSGNQLHVVGDGSGNLIRVEGIGSGEFAKQSISYWDGSHYVEVGQYAGFDSLLIDSGTGNDLVNIISLIYPGSAVTINGDSGNDQVNLYDLPRHAAVNVRNGLGHTDLLIHDPVGDVDAAQVTVDKSRLTLAHPGFDNTYVVNYTPNDLGSLGIVLGNAGNSVAVNDTADTDYPGMVTTIDTGSGNAANIVNVLANFSPLTVIGHGPNTTVNVGNPTHGVQDIGADVKLQGNFSGRTTLNVDDSGDHGPVTARQILPGMGFDIIRGLAPHADISYRGVQTGAVHITLGSGANSFTVENTDTAGSGDATTLDTGTGSAVNFVNVLGTDQTTPLIVVGHGPNTVVNVGNPNRGVQDIQGLVKLQGNFSGRTTLNVDDTGDSNPVTATQTLPGVGFDIIRGLAPAEIQYRGVQTGAVNITLGSGANSFTVENTNTAGSGDATTLNTGTGDAANIVNVLGTNLTTPLIVVGRGPNTTVNVSNAANRLDDLHGRLTVTGEAGSTTLVVINDSADSIPPAGPITFGNDLSYGLTIDGLVPLGIYLRAAQNATLNTSLLAGAGNKTFRMQSAPRGVALNLNAGSDTDTLDYTSYAGNVLVNLPRGEATGFNSITNIYRVTGASGGAPGSYNVLVGFGGNILTGGTGRSNLLIAGGLASTLFGANADDILIGGTTDYDTSDQWQAAFTAIMNEWTQATDYATRADHIQNGGGLNDPYMLNASTVHSNGGGNVLIGHGGGVDERNVYFASLGDTTDQDPAVGEQLVTIV
jgi:hypothetical protein